MTKGITRRAARGGHAGGGGAPHPAMSDATPTFDLARAHPLDRPFAPRDLRSACVTTANQEVPA